MAPSDGSLGVDGCRTRMTQSGDEEIVVPRSYTPRLCREMAGKAAGDASRVRVVVLLVVVAGEFAAVPDSARPSHHVVHVIRGPLHRVQCPDDALDKF